jgi:hypothetical protein
MAMISGLAVAAVAGAGAFFAFDGRPEKTAAPASAVETGAVPAPGVDAVAPEDQPMLAQAVDDNGGDETASEATANEETAEMTGAAQESSGGAGDIVDFSLGSIDDLRREQLSSLVDELQSVGDVADKTKVWVATADVARAPGVETFYHIKGPLNCGRMGCDLFVIGDAGGSRRVLLETVGEAVSSPQMDTLVINEGTASAVTWVYDGAEFVRK